MHQTLRQHSVIFFQSSALSLTVSLRFFRKNTITNTGVFLDDLKKYSDQISKECDLRKIKIYKVLSKHRLGRVSKKLPFVSAVAVLDYRGAEVKNLAEN